MRLDIFLPVYNEGKRIRKNFMILKNYLDRNINKKNIKTRIFFVDDNSKDNTLAELKKLKKEYAIKYFHFNKGPSRRENLGQAMASSSADFIMLIDFDLATDLKHLDQVISLLKKGYNLVTGSRYLKESKLKREMNRLLISRVYNWFMRFYFGSKLYDHQCGFKAFSRKEYRQLIKETGYDSTYSRGWFWDVEMLVRAQKHGYKVKEIPVVWNAGKQSSFNIRRELRMLPTVFKLRFKL